MHEPRDVTPALRWSIWKRRLARVSVVLLLAWITASGLATWALTRRLRARAPEVVPAVTWARFQDVRLATRDGQQLGAWLHQGLPNRPVVVLLHGHGSCRTREVDAARPFAAAGCSVLAISFRAHGDSTGDSCDVGWSSRLDVVAAVAECERRFPERPVLLVGRSMGAAAAIFAAQELGDRIAGYLLEQPYRDLDTAVWHRIENRLPPVVDRTAYTGMRLWAPVCLPMSISAIAPIDHIQHIPESTPIVILAGSADMNARPEEAIDLQQQVATHCRLVLLDGWCHMPCTKFDSAQYASQVASFLDAVASAGSR